MITIRPALGSACAAAFILLMSNQAIADEENSREACKLAEAATQWLLWQLKGDVRAGAMFVGNKCGICTAPEWKIERKNQR